VLLTPVAAPEHKWLSVTLAGAYVLLALASWADYRSRRTAAPPDDPAAPTWRADLSPSIAPPATNQRQG
jgi:hypothetical protein